MATPLTYLYTTDAEVQRFMSAGMAEACEDHDEDGVVDPGVMGDAIIWATSEINLYCGRRYGYAQLAEHAWINRIATLIASIRLSITRGNEPPRAWVDEYERALEELKKIRDGVESLDGLMLKYDERLAHTNLTIDRRFPRAKIRVEQQISSDQKTNLTQFRTSDVPSVY